MPLWAAVKLQPRGLKRGGRGAADSYTSPIVYWSRIPRKRPGEYWGGEKDRTALDAATFASQAPKWGRSERGWASGSEGSDLRRLSAELVFHQPRGQVRDARNHRCRHWPFSVGGASRSLHLRHHPVCDADRESGYGIPWHVAPRTASRDAMLLDHYLRAVDRKTAKQYWKILPPKARGKVVRKNVVRKKALNALSQRPPVPP